MAKNPEVKYNLPPKDPDKDKSPEELAKIDAQNRAEAAKKAQELFESVKKKAEKFKTDALKSYKKEIKGIVVLPPKGPDAKGLDLLVLMEIEGTFEEKFKKKDEIEKKLKEMGGKHLPDVNISAVELDEIWDMCSKGKYEILGLLAMAIYDTGWVGALRVAEILELIVLNLGEKFLGARALVRVLVKGRATEES